MNERRTAAALHADRPHLPTVAGDVRAALHRTVAGTAFAARRHDAALAATEIVTNAVLHGHEPITVTITVSAERLRVEVSDASPVSPTFSLLDPTAVTGRGMLLVSSLADHWGIEPHPDGKTAWMELASTAPAAAVEADIDALLAAWGDGLGIDPAEECVRVVLTDLDVARLAASEAHTEGVLRELALILQSEDTAPRVTRVAAQVLAAAERVESARTELKRQVAVAARGDAALVDVELAIRRADAELVRDYRQALETADRLCAEGELLNERPPADAIEIRNSCLNRILAQLGS